MDGWMMLAGLGVGAMVGATGVGGGSMMTPLLTGPFGLPVQLAVGTDLFFASATKGVGAAAGAAARRVDWALCGRLLSGSLPAALITAWGLSAFLPAAKSSALMHWAIGLALLLTGVSTLVKKPGGAASRARVGVAAAGVDVAGSPAVAESATIARTTAAAVDPAARFDPSAPPADAAARARSERRRGRQITAAGVFVGALTALSSIGAGAIVMALLLRLYPERDTRVLVATDIAHAVPLALLTGVAYAVRGSVDWGVLAGLLIGSLPGILIGQRLADALPMHLMRKLLGALLGVLGAKYLFI